MIHLSNVVPVNGCSECWLLVQHVPGPVVILTEQ